MQSIAEDRHAVPFGQLSVSLETGPVKVVLHLRAEIIRFCSYLTHLFYDMCENGILAAVSLMIIGAGKFSYGRR